jgi:hypothetical protein
VTRRWFHTYIPNLQPVEEYLKLKGRYRHLFEPAVQRDVISHIKSRVNTCWQTVGKANGGGERRNKLISLRDCRNVLDDGRYHYRGGDSSLLEQSCLVADVLYYSLVAPRWNLTARSCCNIWNRSK